MGALAVTYFCHKGHIVLDIPHHGIGYEEPVECPYCQSTNIRGVTEWGDPDYSGSDIVCRTPIRKEEIKAYIQIYDVNKLFRRKKCQKNTK